MATYKPKRKLQDGQLEEIKIPSSSVEGLNLFTYKARIKPYLYTMVYDTLDYDYAKQYIDEKYNHYSAGCSTISKGNFVGRNFDWYYDNEASFVVRTSRSQGRYASVGVASGIKELSDEFANSNENSNLYKVLPFLMEDGINEHSVYCNINVVPAGDKGLTSGTTPQIEQLEKISGVMLVRYILDKFSSAKEAVEYIRDYVSVYGLKPENGEAQEFHFLVRDLTNTYILEFVNNALVILSSTDSRFTAIPNNKDIMMNFYLSGWNGQVKSVVMGNSVADVQATGLTDHAMGLERYNIASNKYNNLTTKEAFVDLMTNDLKYTQTYDENTSPFWHSEYNAQYQTFGDVTIYSAASAYSEVEAYSKGKFVNRSRDESSDNFGTWQTAHSSIYDVVNKCLYLYVQEEDSETTHKLVISYADLKTSELINDIGYITSSSLPESTSELTNDGKDGTSPYATEEYVVDYVDSSGGKIDTIKVNGTAQTITDKTVNISVPTKTSDITNDSGFITEEDIPEIDESNLVHKTGNETIAGVKTFTQRPKLFSGESILPDDYQQVEYIAASGTQYIDTGYTASLNTDIELEFAFTSLGESNINVFGSRTGAYENDNIEVLYASISGTRQLVADFGNAQKYRTNGVISAGTKYRVICNKNQRTIYDGNRIIAQSTIANSSAFTGTYNLYLFATNNGVATALNLDGRFYNCKIRNNNTLVRELIPCYRKSDSVVGMYDIVNDVFYTNAGTGTFTKGDNVVASSDFATLDDIPTIPDVPTKTSDLTNDSGFITEEDIPEIDETNLVHKTGNETINGVKTFNKIPVLEADDVGLPASFQRVECITSSGNQYIDTGLKVHMNYHYEITFKKSTATSYRIWGAFNQTAYDGGFNCSLTYSVADAIRWTTTGNVSHIVDKIFGIATYDTNIHTVDINNGLITADGVNRGKSQGHSNSGVSNYNAYLFTINAAGTTTNNLKGSVYLYKVWNSNGNLVQNLIPCYRKSDNVVGMYDVVNDVFYTNAGTGAFTKGADVSSEAVNFATLNDIPTIPDIPTKTSDLTNDSGFLTSHQDISGKLDKDSTANVWRVYANKNGTQGFYDVSGGVAGNTLAYRQSNGALKVGAPQADDDAATKAFVNSSIATSTSVFRGTSAAGLTEAQFLAWANGLTTKTNNDYVFWNTTDSAGNVIYKRYKYSGSSWIFEYDLNNSSFTAAQWDAVNSGITSAKVGTYDGYASTISGKLDKDTTTGVYRVYANKNGVQGTYEVSDNVSGVFNIGTIPLRTSGGGIRVPSPSNNSDAANKSYVDNHHDDSKEDKLPTAISSGLFLQSTETPGQYQWSTTQGGVVSITESTQDGYINVDGTDVPIHNAVTKNGYAGSQLLFSDSKTGTDNKAQILYTDSLIALELKAVGNRGGINLYPHTTDNGTVQPGQYAVTVDRFGLRPYNGNGGSYPTVQKLGRADNKWVDLYTIDAHFTNRPYVGSAQIALKSDYISTFYNDVGYATASQIPENTSDLNNDSGFITSSSLPTKVSDLTNDAGYITSASLPTNHVTTDTAQTISGTKTFTSNVAIASGTNEKILTLGQGKFRVNSGGSLIMSGKDGGSIHLRPYNGTGNGIAVSTGSMYPEINAGSTGQKDLGSSSSRWNTLYASTGNFLNRPTVNGSGLALKSEIPTTYVKSVNGNSGDITNIATTSDVNVKLTGTKQHSSNPDVFLGYTAEYNNSPNFVLTFKSNNANNGLTHSTTQSLFDNSNANFYASKFTASDLNIAPSNATKNGFWYVKSSSTTGNDANPFIGLHSSNNDFKIISNVYDTNWLQQIATDFRSDGVFIRRKENGTWKTWRKLAYTDEIPVYTSGQNITIGSDGTIGVAGTQSGTGAVAIVGTATNTYATAVGYNATAKSTSATAVGVSANASTNATAVGVSAKALAQNSAQIGEGTNTVANSLQFRSTQIVDGSGKITTNNLAGVSTATAGQVLTANGDGTASFQTSGGGGGGGLNEYIVNLITQTDTKKVMQYINFYAKGRIWLEIPDLLDTPSPIEGQYFLMSTCGSDSVIGMNFCRRHDDYKYNASTGVLKLDDTEQIITIKRSISGVGSLTDFLLTIHNHQYNTSTKVETEEWDTEDYSSMLGGLSQILIHYENDSEISFT